jgi:hydroxymethylpyrimidine/phosphomethylpyrimidine kinase
MYSMKYHVIPTLTIAGSDSSGGAGLEADMKTMSALGCYAMAVVTAVTAQNTCGVDAVQQVDDSIVSAQLHAVFADIPPRAIKVGMVGRASTMHVLGEELRGQSVPKVIDPVMVATSGSRLMDEAAVGTFVSDLLPLASVLTPNIPEGEVLADMPIANEDDMRRAARRILDKGCRSVLLKGGHLDGNEKADLLMADDGSEQWFRHPTVDTPNTHGTGCTLSSAIAAHLAQGLTLAEAVGKAEEYLWQALKAGSDLRIGKGHGPVNHFFSPLPLITEEEEQP